LGKITVFGRAVVNINEGQRAIFIEAFS
jgi:hypothetical protein